MIYCINIEREEQPTKENIKKLEEEYSAKLGTPIEVSVNYTATLKRLPFHTRIAIGDLHTRLTELIYKADYKSLPNKTLKKIGDEITEIEFKLQELWGFPKDRASHTHWLRPIKCKCPKLDNKDAWGHEYYINEECPLHGTNKEES